MMCMLFINNFNCDARSDYTLILLFIRDEFYSRPSLDVRQWPHNSSIIGGVDMIEGRQGGAWLAVNRNSNKIGAVLRGDDHYASCYVT